MKHKHFEEVQGLANELLDSQLNHYLLLDSLALSDYLFEPAEADSDTLPPTPDIREAISKIDPFTSMEWVWEDTLLDDQEEYGPILVSFDNDSPLIEYFDKNWSSENLGILFTSKEKPEPCLLHLQSLIMVTLPSGSQSRFSLQLPLNLTNILFALDLERSELLLGPIQQIIWKDKRSEKGYWLYRKNHHPNMIERNEMPWFEFSHAEMEVINQNIRQLFRDSITDEMMEILEQKSTDSKPEKIKHLLDTNRAQMSLLVEKHINKGKHLNIVASPLVKQLVRLSLYHQQFLSQPSIDAILTDLSLPADIRLHQINQKMPA